MANCTQTVRKPYTICIQNVHKLYTKCTQNTHKTYTNCTQTVHKLVQHGSVKRGFPHEKEKMSNNVSF